MNIARGLAIKLGNWSAEWRDGWKASFKIFDFGTNYENPKDWDPPK